MNRQTLNYHTKLHDWYRQHTIQQDRQQQQQQVVHHAQHAHHASQPQQGAHTKGTSTSKAKAAASKQSHLSTDKIYSIDQWCSDVNSSLFCIKKKEASPLYRKCRLSASTKSAMTPTRASDPRRVRSAEVFTRTGHWAKQPRPMVKGGELLATQQGTGSVSHISTEKGSRVEFCVTNSKELTRLEEGGDKVLIPRINHNYLSLRSSSGNTQKQAGDRIVDKTVVLSPRFIPNSLLKSNMVKTCSKDNNNSQGQNKAKTVTVSYIVNSLVRESEEKENEQHNVQEAEVSKQTKDQKCSNGYNNTNNNDRNNNYNKKNRIFSGSQKSLKSVKTNIQSSVLGGGDNLAELASLTPSVRFCGQDAIPSFCNTCSGIYSGNAPPPTPVTCGSCVHGIHLGSTGMQQSSHGPSQAQIQKELAQNLVKTEKIFGERITSANIELKMSASRLTEDSIHYSAEREMVRNSDSKPGFMMPSPFDDLEDERNISFQDDTSNQSESNDKMSGTNMSTESPTAEKPCNDDTSMGKEDKEMEEDKQKQDLNDETQGYVSSGDDYDDDDDNEDTGSMPPPESFARRSSRRMSLCFPTRPEVSSISTSNHLLRVLSIDDCKMAMRYNPHKVLEEHQMADSPRAELIKEAMGKFGSELMSMEEDKDSQVAMRLSHNSAVTTLHSSSANNATMANKLQYKILFGTEDLGRIKNMRPQSAYLSKAFQTMIHDRTIMQRMDKAGHSERVRNTNTLSKTIEGPKYRIINTALKREMGNIIQAQRQKILARYERQKSGGVGAKYKKPESPSQLSSKSLSLESLPSFKKGILNGKE